MSNQTNINQQIVDNNPKGDSTLALTRRDLLVGTAAIAGMASVSGSSLAQGKAPQPIQGKTPQPTTGPGKLKGRVALVTGAARGIGRASALTLAREGADVIICDIARQIPTVTYLMSTPQDLAETERLVEAFGRRCIAVQADTRNIEQMREMVERGVKEFGKIDILHANAGINHHVSLAQMKDEEWRDVIDVNLTGTANTLRAVIPHMLSRKSGRIVATASDAGRKGIENLTQYTAAKWGVIGLVKSAALELAPSGITVNAVAPGLTKTGMTQNQEDYCLFRSDLANPTHDDAAVGVRKMRTENNQLPILWLEPEDIANGVLYLVSDEGRYVTGAVIDITAGSSAHYTA